MLVIKLIVDNIRLHHAKIVKALEEKNSKYIKLFYLPAYNLDECLNQNYKQSVNRNIIPKDKEHLRINMHNRIYHF